MLPKQNNDIEDPTHDEHEPQLMPVQSTWYQRGNYIYRKGDELHIGSRIPTDRVLVGTDDEGNPILEKIKLT